MRAGLRPCCFDGSAVHRIKQMKNKQWVLLVLLINNRPFEPGASHAAACHCVFRGEGSVGLERHAQRWDGVTVQVKDEHRAWHQQALRGGAASWTRGRSRSVDRGVAAITPMPHPRQNLSIKGDF